MIETVRYVKHMAQKDSRIVIVPPAINIKEMLERDGYPMKSKWHSHILRSYQRHYSAVDYEHLPKYIRDYLGEIGEGHDKPPPSWLLCPKSMRYQFTPDFTLKVSNLCCDNLKKKDRIEVGEGA